MMRCIAAIVICCLSTSTYAQESALTKTRQVRVSYLGEFIVAQPGLRVGFSHDLWVKTKRKEGTKNFPEGKIKAQSLVASYQLGFYSKYKLYTSVPLSASLTYNQTMAKAGVMSFGAGLGYDRTFLKGHTYTVDDDGTVNEKRFASSGYMLSQYSIGLGVDCSKFSNPLPISIMYKNALWVKHGYNDTFLPQWFTEIELSYTLKNRK